jgi:Tol biopolymer transport system component
MRVRRSVTRVGAAAVLGTCAVLAGAAPGGGGRFVLVSETAAGGAGGDGSSFEGAVTPNGRFAAFWSAATDLVDPPTNFNHVFVRDMRGGATSLLSASPSGEEGLGNSRYPSISNNGRYVVYESDASNLVEGDVNGRMDVFLADRKTGDTLQVSAGPKGGGANSSSRLYGASLSGNGRYAVFYSPSTDLVEGGSNGGDQIYLYDRVLRGLALISRNPAGDPCNGSCNDPSISANGRFVAYVSDATDLTASPADGAHWNIFLYDARAGTTEQVTVGTGGTAPDGTSLDPVVSSSGRLVGYSSDASNLVDGDTNGLYDAFLADRSRGTTTRISLGPSGAEGDSGSFSPVISSSGRVVLFPSYASNLVVGDANGEGDVFRWDARTGTVARITVAADGTESDGESWVSASCLASNGRWVAVMSRAANLAPEENYPNGSFNLFLHRLR